MSPSNQARVTGGRAKVDVDIECPTLTLGQAAGQTIIRFLSVQFSKQKQRLSVNYARCFWYPITGGHPLSISYGSVGTVTFNQSAFATDTWLAKSALQKAIRRGDVTTAWTAVRVLAQRQPDQLWRRLVVIALEDVGIGDLSLVHQVLTVSGKKSWRAQNGGDEAIANTLVDRLCQAPKCRDACELLVIADLHPSLKKQRTHFLDFNEGQLCEIVADADRDIAERTLAAWLIAGTKRFPAFSLPEVDGSFSVLLDVYRHLGVPDHVLEMARMGSTRTQEGHPLTLPLVWLAADASSAIEPVGLPPSSIIHGWPAEAYDMHTRPGRRALSLFTERSDTLRTLMARHLSPKDHADFLGSLVFRSEGHLVDRRIVYPGSQALLTRAEAAHLTYSGFPETLVTDALGLLQECKETLLQCRRDVTAAARSTYRQR
jgi:hypothetical protein